MNGTDLIMASPADVPSTHLAEYRKNYQTITQKTNRLLLFACDQKIEHLNDDFYGEGIHADAMTPDHLFSLANGVPGSTLATHLGLIARYGKQYPSINYIVKLNGKTNILSTQQHDPLSAQLWSVADVIHFKKNSDLSICGVGYTVYLGSMFEATMLEQAAQIIYQAHQQGLIAIIWMYIRGKDVPTQRMDDYIIGSCGVAASLGADFVKIKAPSLHTLLRLATVAAGNTQVICAGGKRQDPIALLQEIDQQLTIGGTAGCAIGRNIFQHALAHGRTIFQAVQALVIHKQPINEVINLYQKSQSQ